MPVNAPSSSAASATVRAIGPAVSWVCEMGTIPARLIKPTVGLIPTMPLTDDGQTIEPLVSVPMASGVRSAETATAEPELDPQGFRSKKYGLRVSPPRALQPLVEPRERKLAHSLRLVFAMSSAPALRSLAATPESRETPESTKASDPAVVCIPSAVSMLSLSMTGMPCKGPRGAPARRSASSRSASSRAAGLASMIELRLGPVASMAAIRSSRASQIERDVQRPEASPPRSSATEASVGSSSSLSGAGRRGSRSPQPCKSAPPASSRRSRRRGPAAAGSGRKVTLSTLPASLRSLQGVGAESLE